MKESRTQRKKALPAIASRMELVADAVCSSTIHGWHTCRLLRHKGTLYALAKKAVTPEDVKKFRPAAPLPLYPRWGSSAVWAMHTGLLFRRGRNGRWTRAAVLPASPYSMAVGPDSAFWFASASWWSKAEVYRTRNPLDFKLLDEVHNGTCSYLSAAVDAKGNYIVMYADDVMKHVLTRKGLRPCRGIHIDVTAADVSAVNGVTAAFFDAGTQLWHKSRIDTPEGRYGYEGIILNGRKALAVIESTIIDPFGSAPPSYHSWRHLRLCKCDDLTDGKWVNKPWIMPKKGVTILCDMTRGPDKKTYLAYGSVGGDGPIPLRIARIDENLEVESFATGLNTVCPCLFLAGRYVLSRPQSDGDLHLWELDSGFKAAREYVLPGTARLQSYVLHTLRPERFGGESDGNTVHLLGTEHLDAKGKMMPAARYWHAEFNLPPG